jgi:hypothetical protein
LPQPLQALRLVSPLDFGFSQKCLTPSLPKQGFYILHEIALALLEVLIS